MIHDVVFNDDVSAYHDWNIVLVKADVPLPEPKLTTVDVMGADGVIDLSEILTGEIKYNNRKVKLTFELMDDEMYADTITEISNYLHGKKVTFTLTNDDEFYYSGRATINIWECSRRKGKIVISVDCEPYKMEVEETVITIPLKDTQTSYKITNLRKTVCPTFGVSNTATVVFGDKTTTLLAGTHQIVDVQLADGENTIAVRGEGTLKITYRRGAL